jgi:hypothetical protein
MICSPGNIHFTPECITRLNEIDFTWDPLRTKQTLFLESLKSYKKINGHLNIPIDYIIPHESPLYPEKSWGMKIGCKTHNFLYRGDYLSYHEQFGKLGLSTFKLVSDTRHWEFIYTGLKAYRVINGHLHVRVNHTDHFIFFHFLFIDIISVINSNRMIIHSCSISNIHYTNLFL